MVTRGKLGSSGLLIVEHLGSAACLALLLHGLLAKAVSWSSILAPGPAGQHLIGRSGLPATSHSLSFCFQVSVHSAHFPLLPSAWLLREAAGSPLLTLLTPGGLSLYISRSR